MKVSELMNKKVIACPETASLGDAARLMWENDIGFLPVLGAEGALTGVITDRDGFIASYFQGKPIREIPVKAAMSTRIASCAPGATLGEAEEIMSETQVHRLPVVEDGKVLGVISINDLARRAAALSDEQLEEEVALTLGAIGFPRNGEAPAGAS